MPERLAYEMFACDLEAMGVTPGVESPCGCATVHDHAAAPTDNGEPVTQVSIPARQ
jgi:hypothetical protein